MIIVQGNTLVVGCDCHPKKPETLAKIDAGQLTILTKRSDGWHQTTEGLDKVLAFVQSLALSR